LDMRTISLDLRERILASYDQKEGTREEIAHRYRVSLGMVKKLLQRRRHLGDIGPRYHRCGLRPGKVAAQRQTFRQLLSRKPDLTLEELRAATGLKCSLPAIHYVLEKMGLTYKKRRSAPANKTGRTLPGHAASGGESKRRSIRPA
jgi:transposase